jgi:hypothetical protein
VRFALRVGLFWLLILEVSLFSSLSTTKSHAAWLLNAAIFTALVLHPSVRAFLTRMPAPHLAVFAAIFFAFAAGHHFESHRRQTFFPFVQWDMFSRVESDERITYYEYEGITAGGSRVRLNATPLFPPMRHSRLTAALLYRVRNADRNPRADRTALVALLAAIGREHNRVGAADPIRAIEVVGTTTDRLHAPPLPDVREVIARVELD